MNDRIRPSQAFGGRFAGENIPRGPAERANRMTVMRQRLYQMPPDESRRTGYCDVHAQIIKT
jgi:hypothetical protein